MLGAAFSGALQTASTSGDTNFKSYSKFEVDLLNPDSYDLLLTQTKPDVLINCAAFTAVDACETNEEISTRVNGMAPGWLGQWCKRHQLHLIHFSTDYVFDGSGHSPWLETDAPQPVNAYGQGKLQGEKNILESECSHSIFRVQWLYGKQGNNFVHTMQKLGSEKSELSVVNDQVGALTLVDDIVSAVLELVPQKPQGIFNLANSDFGSWYDVVLEMQKLAAIPKSTRVAPVSSSQFLRPAKRPLNSRLNQSKVQELLKKPLRTWQEALSAYLE